MRRLVRSVVDQASGGARLSTEDPMTQLTGPGAGSVTTSIATEHAPATMTTLGEADDQIVEIGIVREPARAVGVNRHRVGDRHYPGPPHENDGGEQLGSHCAEHTPILSELQTTSAASGARTMLTASRAASPIRRMDTWYDITSEGRPQASWQFPSSEGGGYG